MEGQAIPGWQIPDVVDPEVYMEMLVATAKNVEVTWSAIVIELGFVSMN